MARPNFAGLLHRLQRDRDDALMVAAMAAQDTNADPLRNDAEVERYLDDADRYERRLRTIADPIQVVSEPLTYRPDVRESYFADLFATQAAGAPSHTSRSAAAERLERHAREMDLELTRRAARAEQQAQRAASSQGITLERRALTPSGGSAGYFTPPLWLLDEFASVARAGRTLVDRTPFIPLPAGVMSVSVPRITATAGTAVQDAAAGDAISDAGSGFTDAEVKAPVVTIAGFAYVPYAMLEQTPPPGFDRWMFQDLAESYGDQLEGQAINGTGSNGQIRGILNVSGITTITDTTATPDGASFLASLGKCASKTATARKRPPTLWLLAARRWFWLASQVDANGTPFLRGAELVDPADLANGDGPFGPLAGLPAFIDGALPLTLNTDQDVAIATRPSDHLLLESDPQVMVAYDTDQAGNLQAVVRLYGYAAFTAERYPTATGIVTGSAMAAPAGY